MSGNVWEWCWDWYGTYTSASLTNPIGASSGSFRLLRSGGWGDDGDGCRVSVRYGKVPNLRDYYIGFRVAEDL